jgi:signal transduction histidine kinase
LAGVTLGLHAAAANVTRSPEQAVAQIGELTHQVEESVKDIRRLVYGLRPPALDELGLARAVQREAQRLEGGRSDLSIAVEIAEGGLGALPAAVEVAAYRIVCEALTNVSRHAYARTCKVRLVRDATLCLEVTDDGRGINGHAPGVGLTAMRERAEELGGTLRVYSEGVGTRVFAELPVELI